MPAELDPAVTLALAEASVAAYSDFAGTPFKPPPNYKTFSRLTGWDPYSGAAERFGLIFRGSLSSNQDQFIVAFRGTDSLTDVLDDTMWGWAIFAPYRNSISPTPKVHRGFYEIYSTALPQQAASLREQVFQRVPATASQVLVTGHSLGAALAQLFTLDCRVSLPSLPVSTLNFASPRVGGTDWATACARVGASQLITRVINYWDYVPDYPPELFGYVTIGSEFQTAFSGPTWAASVDELPRHSMLNLQTVLAQCVWRTPQIWSGTFLDAVWGWYDMSSTAPPQAAKDQLLAKRQEMQELEAAIRSETINPT